MKFSRQNISDILNELSVLELRSLRSFLLSPYYVKPKESEIYIKLLEVISNNKFLSTPDIDHKKILFEKIFPDKSFVAGKIEKKMAQFMALLLDFLGLEEMQKSSRIELETLKALRTRGLSKLYVKRLKKNQKDFSKDRNELVDGYLTQFELHLEECRFKNMDPAINDQESYDLTYNSLDDLYVKYFIYLGIVNLTYNNYIKPKEIRSRFEKLVYMLEQRRPFQISTTQKFEENLFRILLDGSLIGSSKIENLAKQLESIKEELNIESYKNYRTLIRSFTLAKYNSGDLFLGSFIFQMYKQEVENKSIFFKNKIPSAVVNNIVLSALRENKIEWLDEFLTSIEDKILEPGLNGFTIALNRGKLLFAQRKYQEVLEILIFDVKNFYFKVHARILELMTYYELEIDQLHHKIDAYKIFIYRLPKSKIGKDFITGHNNFIRILRSICHTSTIFDLNRIQRLKAKIIETKILAEKQWLLEKVNILEEKNS